MQPTEILLQEHRVIEGVLDCLEVMAQRCADENKLDIDAANKAIEFFQNYADRCHHGKEEECLFPLLESKGFPREQGPTGVMRHEHEAGRRYVRGMATAIDAIASGDPTQQAEFVSCARDFTQLLREHISKEDHCLFPMADRALSEQDQRRLMESFAQIEQVDLGSGIQEKYLNLAKELTSQYGIRCCSSDMSSGPGCCSSRE